MESATAGIYKKVTLFFCKIVMFFYVVEKRRRIENTPPSEAGSSTAGGPSCSTAGGPSGSNTRPDRQKRDRLEIIVSREKHLTTKQGKTGTPLQLTGNFFKLLKKPTWSLYQYRVDFKPDIEIPGLRKRLMYEQKPLLGGYLFDSKNTVYLTQKLKDNPTEVNTKDREENPIQIGFKWVGIIEMNTRESLQVLNIILRRSMEGLKLQLIGRNFFDAAARVCYILHNLILIFFKKLILGGLHFIYLF